MLQRNGQYWSSTRDTAAVLTALADYLSTQPAGLPGGQVNILLNGQPLRSVVFEGETLRKGEMTVQIPAVNLQSGKNEITLQRTSGTGAMFYSMQLRQTVATEEMAAEPLQGLNINREYLNIVPRRLSGERYTLAAEPANNISRERRRSACASPSNARAISTMSLLKILPRRMRSHPARHGG